MKGNKITLRPIKKSDLHILNIWKNDEELYMYLGGGFQPLSEDQQEKWMDSIVDMTGNSRRFMIMDRDKNPIGMVGLYDINWIHRTCEIGAYIGEIDARGNGYAKEACFLIESFAANYLNLRKIKLKVVADNVTAKKMWENLGYQTIGEYKQERFIKGKYCNVVLMEKFIDTVFGGGGEPFLKSLICINRLMRKNQFSIWGTV